MAQKRERLQALIARLGPEAWPRRFHPEFDRRGRSMMLKRGAMLIGVRVLDDGAFEILYEHAFHECTRERCDFEQAVSLLDALLRREHLCKVRRCWADPSLEPDVSC